MPDRQEITARIIEHGIVAVVRTPRFEQVIPVFDALIAGGIVVLEVTMTVPNAMAALREAVSRFGGRALIGAGTILNHVQCHEVIAAGAEFIVTPITRVEVIPAAHARGKPVMLGAYSPTEAQAAHEAGADFIKIFPADGLGPGYMKSIRAPLPHLRLVPTGGVDLQTAPEFLQAGCVALGIGSSLVPADLLEAENWEGMSQLAGEYVRVVRETREKLKQ